MLFYLKIRTFDIFARRFAKIVLDFDDPQKQISDIDDMREKGVESFIISPSHPSVLQPRIQALYDEGCNVILLSRYVDIPNRTYVGVDYYKSGMLAGEMLTKIMPGGGRIAVVTNSTPKADTTVRGRYEGFVDWIGRNGEYQIAELIENVHTDELAKQTFDYICDKYRGFNDLDAVYDITYKLNILAKKLSARNEERKLKLVGFDVYPEIVEHVRSNAVDIVIGQQLRTQAYDAVKLMFHKLCYGIDYKRGDYFSELNVVVSSNIDCFI